MVAAHLGLALAGVLARAIDRQARGSAPGLPLAEYPARAREQIHELVAGFSAEALEQPAAEGRGLGAGDVLLVTNAEDAANMKTLTVSSIGGGGSSMVVVESVTTNASDTKLAILIIKKFS